MLAKLFLRHVRVAGGYVVQHHSQACTTDTALATASECSSAQSELDPYAAAVSTEESAQFSKGCLRWKEKWIFNSHDTDELDGGSNPICQSGNADPNWTHATVRMCKRFSFASPMALSHHLQIHTCHVRPTHGYAFVTEYVVQDHDRACTRDTMVTSFNECSRAKTSFDRDAADVEKESNADTPKGCSLYKGKWYFNSHATGKLDGEREPICQQGNIQSDTTHESNRSYIRA